jgi:hypothetical protein
MGCSSVLPQRLIGGNGTMKSEMEKVDDHNGFEIYDDQKSIFRYHVFHPTFEGVFIDAFMTYSDAKCFCEEENADEWKEELRNSRF